MAFLEQLGKKITSTSQDVAEQTKKLADITRLNSEISSKEKEMEGHLITLGKEYYLAHRDDSNHESVLKVKDLRLAIKNLRDDVGKLKGTKRCKDCGSDVVITHAFCPNCGVSMPKPPVEEEVVVEETMEEVETQDRQENEKPKDEQDTTENNDSSK